MKTSFWRFTYKLPRNIGSNNGKTLHAVCIIFGHTCIACYKIPGAEYLCICIYTIKSFECGVFKIPAVQKGYLHLLATQTNIVQELSIVQMDLTVRVGTIIKIVGLYFSWSCADFE